MIRKRWTHKWYGKSVINAANENIFSTRLMDVKSQGNTKDSFLDCRTTACWNLPPIAGDTPPSETTFTSFSNNSAAHDLSTYNNAAVLDMPSITSPGK